MNIYWQKPKIFWLFFRIFDRDGDRSVSRGEMKGIVENLFHLIAESRREDKSPKEVKKTTTQLSEKPSETDLFFLGYGSRQ